MTHTLYDILNVILHIYTDLVSYICLQRSSSSDCGGPALRPHLPAGLHQATGRALQDLGRLVLGQSQAVVAVPPIGPARNANGLLGMVGI